MTRREILQKYPRLVAHLICESLGYFSVLSAAGAVEAYLRGEPCYCEWYMHMSGAGKKDILAVGRDTLALAIRRRKWHKGYMAEYQRAIAQVKAELEREGVTSNMLAAWF